MQNKAILRPTQKISNNYSQSHIELLYTGNRDRREYVEYIRK